MKKVFIPIIALMMFVAFSCGVKNTEEKNSDTAIAATDRMSSENPHLLIGKWRVDSAGFIDNGVRKPLDVPLANTFWEFTPDNKVSISGSVSLTMDCNVVDNSFKMNMMGVESTYRIITLTENQLVLMSTIMDTKDLKMESISKFSKVK
jgi:hypothetical protein